MKYNKLEYYLSKPRINRFLIASGTSETKALKLYQANLKVAQSFYPILNLFEIFLRNTCHYQVSSHFSNPDWIIDEKTGFMNDQTLTASRFFLKSSIITAEKSITRKGRSITADKIVAEQSFGFWTSLFDTHHYRLIGGVVIHSFKHKPAGINRKNLSQKLNRIREFNRFHIC